MIYLQLRRLLAASGQAAYALLQGGYNGGALICKHEEFTADATLSTVTVS